MKCFFLITLLLLDSATAFGEWVKMAESERVSVYMDSTTIRRNGDVLKVSLLYDLKAAPNRAAEQYLSIKTLREFDCVKEQDRSPATYWYSEHMGAGEVVMSAGFAQEWSPVVPGSMGHDIWRVACRKQ